MVTKAPSLVLCPYWARFVVLQSGMWMAHCSKTACDRLDIERPGWKEHAEFAVGERCQLGWQTESSISEPMVLVPGLESSFPNIMLTDRFVRVRHRWTAHLRLYSLSMAAVDMDDALWDRYVEAFLKWCELTPEARGET